MEEQPTEPATVVGIGFAEHVAREAMELKVRHPLRDNEGHAALFAISAGELLCRCHLPSGWRTTPTLVTEALTALVCDEAFILDEVPRDIMRDGSAVEVLWAACTGHSAHRVLPYRVEAGAAVWAAEPSSVVGSDGDGRPTALLDAMTTGFSRQAPDLDRDAVRRIFGSQGVHVMFSDDAVAFFDVAREDPCPCGSGLRFADCHDA